MADILDDLIEQDPLDGLVEKDPLDGLVAKPAGTQAKPQTPKPKTEQKPVSFGKDYGDSAEREPAQFTDKGLWLDAAKDVASGFAKGVPKVWNETFKKVGRTAQLASRISKKMGPVGRAVIGDPEELKAGGEDVVSYYSGPETEAFYTPKSGLEKAGMLGGQMAGGVSQFAMGGGAALPVIAAQAGLSGASAAEESLQSGAGTGKAIITGAGTGLVDFLAGRAGIKVGRGLQEALATMPSLRASLSELAKATGKDVGIATVQTAANNILRRHGIDPSVQAFEGLPETVATTLAASGGGGLAQARAAARNRAVYDRTLAEVEAVIQNKLNQPGPIPPNPQTHTATAVAPSPQAASSGTSSQYGDRTIGRATIFADKPLRMSDRYPAFREMFEPIAEIPRVRTLMESKEAPVRETISSLPQDRQKLLALVMHRGRSEKNPNGQQGLRFTEQEFAQMGFTPKEFQVYEAQLDSYRRQAESTVKSLVDAANKATDQPTADGYIKAANHLSAALANEAAYVPATRFGKVKIDLLDPNGKRVATVSGDNEIAARKNAMLYKQQLKARGVDANLSSPKELFDGSTGFSMGKVDPGIIEEIANSLGVPKQVAQDIAHLYPLFESERNMGKFAQRLSEYQGVPGADLDPTRIHAQYTQTMANKVADITAGTAADQAIAKAPAQFAEYGREYRDFLNDPTAISKSARNISSATTALSMGADPMQIPLQATQNITHGLPTYIAKYGLGRGVKVGIKGAELALKDSLKSGDPFQWIDSKEVAGHATKIQGATPQTLAGELRNFMGLLHSEGILMDVNRSDFIGRTPDPNAGGASRTIQKTSQALLSPLEKMEKLNRSQAAIAAYLGGRQLGLSADEAAKDAIRTANQIHNVGGVENMSRAERMGKGLVGATVLKFKYFGPQYLQQMANVFKTGLERNVAEGKPKAVAIVNAATPVAASGLTTLGLAGVKGIPFVATAWELGRYIYNNFIRPNEQSDEDALRSIDRILEEGMAKAGVDEKISRTVRNGLPATLGVDVSGRFSLDQIANVRQTDTPLEMGVRTALGASYQIPEKVSKAAQKLKEAKPEEAAYEVSPRGIQAAIDAARGKTKMGEEERDLTIKERAMRLGGARPAGIAAEQQARGAEAEKKEAGQISRRALANKILFSIDDTNAFNKLLAQAQAHDDKKIAEGRYDELILTKEFTSTLRQKFKNKMGGAATKNIKTGIIHQSALDLINKAGK